MGLWLFNFEVSSALNFPFRVLFLKFAGFWFLFFSLYPSVALLWSSEPPDPDPKGPNSSQQRLLCSRSTSSVACGLLWLRLDVRDVHIDVLWVHLTSLYLATCPTSSAWAKTFSTMSLKRARRRICLRSVPCLEDSLPRCSDQRLLHHLQTGHTFPR